MPIFSSDGFPGAFVVATADKGGSHATSNHPDYQRLNKMVEDYANLCSLARLLISDRLEYLDETEPFLAQSVRHRLIYSTRKKTTFHSNGPPPFVLFGGHVGTFALLKSR